MISWGSCLYLWAVIRQRQKPPGSRTSETIKIIRSVHRSCKRRSAHREPVEPLHRSVAVERLERLERLDPVKSDAVERFERLEQPHPQWTARYLRSSRLREQNRNFPSLKQMRRDGSRSIQEGGNVKSKDATPSRSNPGFFIIIVTSQLTGIERAFNTISFTEVTKPYPRTIDELNGQLALHKQ